MASRGGLDEAPLPSRLHIVNLVLRLHIAAGAKKLSEATFIRAPIHIQGPR